MQEFHLWLDFDSEPLGCSIVAVHSLCINMREADWSLWAQSRKCIYTETLGLENSSSR